MGSGVRKLALYLRNWVSVSWERKVRGNYHDQSDRQCRMNKGAGDGNKTKMMEPLEGRK